MYILHLRENERYTFKELLELTDSVVKPKQSLSSSSPRLQGEEKRTHAYLESDLVNKARELHEAGQFHTVGEESKISEQLAQAKLLAQAEQKAREEIAFKTQKLAEALKTCSRRGYLAKVGDQSADPYCESDLEADVEIPDPETKLSFTVESNDKFSFSFVGILEIRGVCLIIYPKYIADVTLAKDPQNGYSVLRQLIKVIEKYKKSIRQKLYSEQGKVKESFNLISTALELIDGYFERGLYCNERQVIEVNGPGNILWDKTIAEGTTYLSRGNPVYLDLYTINSETNENDYFQRLHACIITQAGKRCRTVLEILGREVFDLTSETLESFGNLNDILYRLEQEYSVQFITFKQHILDSMRRYLKDQFLQEDSNLVYLLGIKNFEHVWEAVCKQVLADDSETSLSDRSLQRKLGINTPQDRQRLTHHLWTVETNPNHNLKSVIALPHWHALEHQESVIAGNRMIPDILVLEAPQEIESTLPNANQRASNLASIDKLANPKSIARVTETGDRSSNRNQPSEQKSKLHIYDAKYYKIDFRKSQAENAKLSISGQPGIQDLNKQFLYELAYLNFCHEFDLELASNSLLVPYDDYAESLRTENTLDSSSENALAKADENRDSLAHYNNAYQDLNLFSFPQSRKGKELGHKLFALVELDFMNQLYLLAKASEFLATETTAASISQAEKQADSDLPESFDPQRKLLQLTAWQQGKRRGIQVIHQPCMKAFEAYLKVK